MPLRDLTSLAVGALSGYKLRAVLSMLGIAIGISAVILLTSIGEGTRRYVLDQFTQFGTNIIAINPGKTETFGLPGVLGGTTHKLTIDDAEAIARVPGVTRVAPFVIGSARVESGGRGRSIYIYGCTSTVTEVFKFAVRQGKFLPPGDPRRGAQVAVLGATVKRELFGKENPLGQLVRIAGQRFRVIGVMEPKGTMLGLDIDDAVWIPLSRGMKLFNLDELWEIDLNFANARLEQQVADDVRALLTERHGGREDFTLTTQTEMLAVFGNVMDVITIAVGAIAAISLVVGSIGILTIMWITVGERTSEIGLVRAVGATPSQVNLLFLTESAVLAILGGIGGVAVGLGLAAVLRAALPGLPVHTPLRFVLIALAVSLAVGLLSGVLPARRAAYLDPIEALREE